jgi:YHS domain-containing protein
LKDIDFGAQSAYTAHSGEIMKHHASERRIGRPPAVRPILVCAAALAWFALPHCARAAEGAAPPPPAQFGGQCVEALAEGRHVMTNCTSTWTDKDGKTYCFSNDGAKKSFLENPAENLERARTFIAASSVESTEKAMQDFSGTDAETVVRELIANKLKANNGIFPLEDARSGEHLKLSYDDVDFTRTIDGYGFFPDVKFHDSKDAQKKYLIDFWVMPEDGALQVQEIRIYKEPINADGKWTTVARQPVPWWWIPASEHPGHLATKRGWEVMSAVEQSAVKESAKNNGVFKLKDDKTGKELQLEFVDTHQPVRQLDDGHYFACTDFRVAGTKDQIYDIDFWVSDKDGKMVVDQMKVHKVPELKSGQWIQVPRYEWKDLGSSHVVP